MNLDVLLLLHVVVELLQVAHERDRYNNDHDRKSKFPEAGFTAKPKSGERVIVETARAEAELGFSSWKEMEEQVVDVVEQQLKLCDA